MVFKKFSVTFMRDIVESNHAVRPSGFQNIDLRPSLLYWFYLSIRPKPRSHRTNWIELQPRTYRYFDFYTTWKMEYEHTFSFSNWNWFLGNNYNRLDLSLASTTLSTHDRPFKRRRNEQWSKSYTQLWVDMFCSALTVTFSYYFAHGLWSDAITGVSMGDHCAAMPLWKNLNWEVDKFVDMSDQWHYNFTNMGWRWPLPIFLPCDANALPLY